LGAVSYNDLNGLQRAALRAALMDAFTRAELEKLLSDQLNRSWDSYVREGGTKEDQFFDVIEASRRGGWINDLVIEAQAKRPANSHIARLDVTLGLMAPTLPPADPLENVSLSLERMIVTSELKDFSDVVAFQGQICRIEAGNHGGTGFLIADDLVLTNYHVIEQVKDTDGASIICRFDSFAKTVAAREGRLVRLSGRWLVACSPYAPEEGTLGGAPPTAQELDFAILRLAEPAGADLVNGMLRGSIKLVDSAPRPVKDDFVLILQCPPDRPLSMSIGAVLGYDASHLRVQYAASTRKGSSGSPVFASNLALVALHHAGDPNWSHAAEYNQGIPIGRIIEWLNTNGVDLTLREDTAIPPPPATSSPARIRSVVVLGEPRPPTPSAASKAIKQLLQLLAARGAPVTHWAEGWRDEKPLSETESAALLRQQPAFIRTIVDQTKLFLDEINDLTYKLHRRFGFEYDDDCALRNELLQSPRILWHPGGLPWPGGQPQPPNYANSDPPENFARWLADLLGLPDTDADTVILCEHPSFEGDGGHAQQIRQAIEQGLIQAIGDKAEPDSQVFAPGRLRDILKDLPPTGLRILALNDMGVPEPATRAGAIDIFRRSDRDIDSIGNCANLIRVAVLVRTAEQFNGQLEFNAKARLRNWYLLRVPKMGDGSYTSDPDNVDFIHHQVVMMRNGDSPATG
jgi:hypothetical protein